MNESSTTEKKSLKLITGKSPQWNDLIKIAVCFANANGGKLMIGIEDDDETPPPQQIIDRNLLDAISKKITQNTLNVGIVPPRIIKSENGGEYIQLEILPSRQTIASTSDARYFMRISDECHPVPPDQLTRLVSEKNAFVWELQTTKQIPRTSFDQQKKKDFIDAIKKSDRVSPFIKEKTDEEILDHYFLAKDNVLTNLGILWIGKREDRASLLYAPTIQFIRYDQYETKIKKITFDDHSKNPIELLEAVLDLPDWNESIEIPQGIFRERILNYDTEVIRELVANALVHRVYVMQGDIYINLYTDRLEIHSPGLLPLGVTPNNILHQSVRRNDHLSRVFYDLKLMEKEGSGFDRIYQILLSEGKQLPLVHEQHDRVIVTITAKVYNYEALRLMDIVSNDYRLKQKSVIALGLIVQHTTLTVLELKRILSLESPKELAAWIRELQEGKLILTQGLTKATEYYVNPDLLRKSGYKGKTTLKQIEDHRLRELLIADLRKFPRSLIGEIQERIGKEIPLRKMRKQLRTLIQQQVIHKDSGRKFARYSLAK